MNQTGNGMVNRNFKRLDKEDFLIIIIIIRFV